jgi:hypothetical protein
VRFPVAVPLMIVAENMDRASMTCGTQPALARNPSHNSKKQRHSHPISY